jgi:EAL domain-containing protein (putative c-di-GMP-specific phosphodiesterase class I)
MRQALAELRLKWGKLPARDKLIAVLALLVLTVPLAVGISRAWPRGTMEAAIVFEPVALALLAGLHWRRAVASNLVGLRVNRAIRNGELFLCFQPKVNLTTGELSGVEALVRWADPKRGLVSPSDFIEGVEASVFGRALDSFVLSAAIDEAKLLEAAGHATPVAVNLSPGSFEDPALASKLCARLTEANLEPDLLQIEVTERVLDAAPNAAAVIEALGDKGIGVALDDFGVGYSALQRLVRLKLECLKIDRSFIADMETNPRASVIVAWAVSLSHQLGATVVAEGVETEEMVHQLRALGVDSVQGYFVSKPLTTQELAVWLDRADTAFPERRGGIDRRERPEVRRPATERRSWSDRREVARARRIARRAEAQSALSAVR